MYKDEWLTKDNNLQMRALHYKSAQEKIKRYTNTVSAYNESYTKGVLYLIRATVCSVNCFV